MNSVDRFTNNVLNEIINPALGVFIGITFAYFLGVVMMYLWQANNEEARTLLKHHMVYGLIGLFIIFSVGGIINLVATLAGAPLN